MARGQVHCRHGQAERHIIQRGVRDKDHMAEDPDEVSTLRPGLKINHSLVRVVDLHSGTTFGIARLRLRIVAKVASFGHPVSGN